MQQEEDPCLKFKTDPRFLSWIGASVLPKLDSAKDMFIHRDKFQSRFQNYQEQFMDLKNKQIRNFLSSQQPVATEEKNAEMTNDQPSNKKLHEEAKDETMKNEEEQPQRELTKAQETMIDNEVTKKLKKERGLEGGVKLVREKVPFIW